jgi:hypothetical protein
MSNEMEVTAPDDMNAFHVDNNIDPLGNGWIENGVNVETMTVRNLMHEENPQDKEEENERENIPPGLNVAMLGEDSPRGVFGNMNLDLIMNEERHGDSFVQEKTKVTLLLNESMVDSTSPVHGARSTGTVQRMVDAHMKKHLSIVLNASQEDVSKNDENEGVDTERKVKLVASTDLEVLLTMNFVVCEHVLPSHKTLYSYGIATINKPMNDICTAMMQVPVDTQSHRTMKGRKNEGSDRGFDVVEVVSDYIIINHGVIC